jgi:hypothetical protein
MPDPRSVTIGLHVEGSSDYDFLEPLLRRLAPRNLERGTRLSIIPIGRRERSHEARLRICSNAIREGVVDLVCLHADADSQRRYTERQSEAGLICAELRNGLPGIAFGCVPVIPIRETEAWALADPQALCTVLGLTKLRDPWPERLRSPEDIPEPKERLKELVAEIRGRRRSVQPMSQLGETVSLDALDRLPAFRATRDAFRDALGAIKHPSSAPR